MQSGKRKMEYDAIVVGSGPNGLSAAIVLQQANLSVLLIEAKDTVGGGMRTAELTLPGFKHDICAAVHPMAMVSPLFRSMPLAEHGLKFIHPGIAAAHPFADGSAAVLCTSITKTAGSLGKDEQAYLQLMDPIVKGMPYTFDDILSPLHFPKHPLAFAKFGMKAIASADTIAKRFVTREARGLWAGLAAHSILPLSKLTTSAVALVLAGAAHLSGWPFAVGGSQTLADTMAKHFISLGGKIETGFFVSSLSQLPSSHAVLLDVDPRQLLQIAGHRFSSLYKWQLSRYRYGMGVFKIDWALDEPIPFTAPQCREAGTVHLGNTYEEIRNGEQAIWQGRHPEQPFVLLSQPSLFDPSRAPDGKHTAWAYCHVPNGSEKDMTDNIEDQVERFAPGFKSRIIGRHTMNAAQMEKYNPNYSGGDIIGGAANLAQLFTRPALRLSPYRTSAKGIYICSSSTPPGGGVHGMCGYHAAKRVLKDLFAKRF